MSIRETSVTQVNAAVLYLIENKANCYKPLKEVNVFILSKMSLKPKNC